MNAPPSPLCALSFPLNAYARALELEEGQAECLHYGLHDTADIPLVAAQRRSTDLLWRHLPPPCRLLEVGVGLGSLLQRLNAAGYSAQGIAPDPAHLACARMRHGNALPAACGRFEDFSEDAGSWDALLLRESAQTIEPLDLFTGASRLLSEHGEIVLLDEFALRRIAPGRESLHVLHQFTALAQRFGFGIVEQFDLSAQAAPTLDYLLRVLARHAATLQGDLGFAANTIETLRAGLAAHRQRYAEGRCGYFLLRLRRQTRPRWRVGRVGPGQAAAMRTLFAEVFHNPMSEALWHWKYGDGRGTGIGVWEGERLIAFYGGIGMNILFFGAPQSAAQSCDVMVAPAGRATLSRRGPLFLVIATYLENQLGYGNPHLLGVGFPSARHNGPAFRLGLYGGPVGRILELSWPAARDRSSSEFSIRPLDLAGTAGRTDADACWAAMRADLGNMIVRVRDAGTLRHRYLGHPEKTYQLFAVRQPLSGGRLGLFVLRRDAEGGCELMDLIGPLAAMPQLVAAARDAAASLGAERLFGWFVDSIQQFVGPDATAKDIDVIVPANAWTDGPPIASMVGKWWLTGGDTDFR